MKVEGTIKNMNGESLPGASVFVSDASGKMVTPVRGVNSDANGNYVITINNGEYITASFVGMQRKTVQPVPVMCITAPCPNKWDFMLDVSSDAALNEVEVAVKKPIPWLLISAVLLASLGIIIFIIDASKKLSKK